MTISANFLLGGTDYTDRGYTATAGGTVALALEDALSTDVKTAVVRIVSASKLATVIPELDVDDPGFAMDPSGGMTLTIPNEVGSWLIEVQINGGASARGIEPTWTRSRIISTVGVSTVRKMVPGERDEYDPDAGWTGAQNDEVDALDASGAMVTAAYVQLDSGGATIINGQGVTSVTRDAQGVVSVVIPARANANYVVNATACGSTSDKGTCNVHSRTTTGFIVDRRYSDWTLRDLDFNFSVLL